MLGNTIHVSRIIYHIFSLVYLILVILTISIAFDVGGVSCGLSYSLTISLLYFFLTTIRLIFKRTRYFRWISILYYCQHALLPSLLTLFLSYHDSGQSDTFSFFPVFIWRAIIVNSTPIFTIAEGFCSLLLIQAIGQIISWLTIYKSDSWLIISLIASGSTITGALYFLYRIYVLPISIDLVNASLLGSILTLTASVGLFGIISGKGSIIESALLFAYIVRCIYDTFPNLSEDASNTLLSILSLTTNNLKTEIPKWTPQLTNTALQFIPFLARNIPRSFKTVWDFFIKASCNLTLSLIIGLMYRLGVFYAATKIIPSIYKVEPSSSISRTPTNKTPRSFSGTHLSDKMEVPPENEFYSTKSYASNINMKLSSVADSHEKPSTIIRLIYTYAPCILIAVYTHLMMSYKGELSSEMIIWKWFFGEAPGTILAHPWQFWHWVNMVTTLLLYMAELISGNSSSSNSIITSHWNTD